MDRKVLKNSRCRDVQKHVSTCCLLGLLLTLAACRNDMEKIAMFDPQNLPQQRIEEVRVWRSENGSRQMELTAPLVESYVTPEKKTVYPHGFAMQIFDDHGKLSAFVTGDSAVQREEKKMVEAYGHIVIIDYSTGDTSYLMSLIWDSGEHLVYSNDPVKSVNGDRVTYGDGFTSDDEFREPIIRGQRGRLTFEDD